MSLSFSGAFLAQPVEFQGVRQNLEIILPTDGAHLAGERLLAEANVNRGVAARADEMVVMTGRELKTGGTAREADLTGESLLHEEGELTVDGDAIALLPATLQGGGDLGGGDGASGDGEGLDDGGPDLRQAVAVSLEARHEGDSLSVWFLHIT